MVYVIAALLAYFVSLAELLTRYKDDPWVATTSLPSLIYTIINALLAVAAVWLLLNYFPHAFSDVPNSDNAGASKEPYDPIKVALVCGFGSLAVLRAGVLKVRIHHSDISVGPAILIDQVLKIVDRLIDRKLADKRSTIAAELAKNVSFPTQGTELILLCLALLQNHNAEEKAKLETLYENLSAKSGISDPTKTTILICALLESLGEKALRNAVSKL
jgi:hypothetical protein